MFPPVDGFAQDVRITSSRKDIEIAILIVSISKSSIFMEDTGYSTLITQSAWSNKKVRLHKVAHGDSYLFSEMAFDLTSNPDYFIWINRS